MCPPASASVNPHGQADIDQLAADLIPYGEVSDRVPALQRVERALAAATSVDQVKHIHDVAVAMAAYARQANDRDREADAAEIRMKAVRRLGEMIERQKATVGLAKGAREPGTKRGSTRVIGKPASMAEAGIGKNLAHQARTLAKMAEPQFEQAVQNKRQAVVERTTTRPAKPAQPAKRATHLELLELWMHLPTEHRRHFFDGIGLSAILENIPEAWADALLERWVGDRYLKADTKCIEGNNQWIEASIAQALILVEARSRFQTDQEFCDWLAANNIELSDDDRAALISLGQLGEAQLREILTKTDSRSYRLIWAASRPQSKLPADNAIPADLSIPDCLLRQAPRR
jgi:hypothetical protein